MSATQKSPVIPIRSSSEPPALIAPANDIFLRRAQRFETLAKDHPLCAWLMVLGELSRAQHAALAQLPALPLPDAETIARAQEHQMPPLPAQSWPRDAAWHDVLRQIADALADIAPTPARGDLARLIAMTDAQREVLAERVLRLELYGDDAALLPYVGAALQVLWTGMAQRIAPDVQRLDVSGVCPCCGFLPVASVVRTAGEVAAMRYLHCALCNTEWNLVRVKCAACDANDKISYRALEGEGGQNVPGVRAETCDSCSSYLKIVYQDKGGVDPVADDLASLALDVMVDEQGYARAGPNLLLIPGDPPG